MQLRSAISNFFHLACNSVPSSGTHFFLRRSSYFSMISSKSANQPASPWFKLQPGERWVRNNLPSWWPFLFRHDFRPTRRSRCIFYNGNSEATATHNLGSTGTGMKFSFCYFLGFFFFPSHVPRRFPFSPIFLLFITTLFHDLKEQFSKNSPAFPSRK